MKRNFASCSAVTSCIFTVKFPTSIIADHSITCTVTHHAFLNLPADIYLRLQFDTATFDLSAMMHPSTYLNKVLLGSCQGAMQLWNIKTRLVF